jgi:hypothetical protein
MGRNALLPIFRKIENLLAGFVVVDNRSYRHRNADIVPVASGLLAAFTVASALGGMFRVEAQVQQRAVMLACFQHNFAAIAAVTAAGAAARHKFLTAKRQAAVTAVSGFNGNSYFVYEHWEN